MAYTVIAPEKLLICTEYIKTLYQANQKDKRQMHKFYPRQSGKLQGNILTEKCSLNEATTHPHFPDFHILETQLPI